MDQMERSNLIEGLLNVRLLRWRVWSNTVDQASLAAMGTDSVAASVEIISALSDADMNTPLRLLRALASLTDADLKALHDSVRSHMVSMGGFGGNGSPSGDGLLSNTALNNGLCRTCLDDSTPTPLEYAFELLSVRQADQIYVRVMSEPLSEMGMQFIEGWSVGQGANGPDGPPITLAETDLAKAWLIGFMAAQYARYHDFATAYCLDPEIHKGTGA